MGKKGNPHVVFTPCSCHRDFGDQVQELLGPLRSKAEPAKVVLVAATLTKVGSPLCSMPGISLPGFSLPCSHPSGGQLPGGCL